MNENLLRTSILFLDNDNKEVKIKDVTIDTSILKVDKQVINQIALIECNNKKKYIYTIIKNYQYIEEGYYLVRHTFKDILTGYIDLVMIAQKVKNKIILIDKKGQEYKAEECLIIGKIVSVQRIVSSNFFDLEEAM